MKSERILNMDLKMGCEWLFGARMMTLFLIGEEELKLKGNKRKV